MDITCSFFSLIFKSIFSFLTKLLTSFANYGYRQSKVHIITHMLISATDNHAKTHIITHVLTRATYIHANAHIITHLSCIKAL